MFLGYLLVGYTLNSISASTATMLTLFEPLVAALFAILLVGEQLALIGWIGMILIFVCLAVLSALLHKDLKCKAPLIEPNLRRNLGKWST